MDTNILWYRTEHDVIPLWKNSVIRATSAKLISCDTDSFRKQETDFLEKNYQWMKHDI